MAAQPTPLRAEGVDQCGNLLPVAPPASRSHIDAMALASGWTAGIQLNVIDSGATVFGGKAHFLWYTHLEMRLRCFQVA